MTEQELYDLLSALNLYTSVFLLFIVLCFIAFIAILLILIHNIKKRKLLKENRAFISEIIQTQEEERKRISQELHDTISQNIKTLLVEQKEFLSNINGTSGHVPNEDTSLIKKCAIEKIEKIINLEKQNQKELRAIIQNLSIPSLHSIPFKPAINDLCEQFSKNEQKHHLLRIIQEALNNVQVHCNAEETSVIIRKSDHSDKEPSMPPQRDTIRIMIFDDGTGFDTAAMQTAHRLHFGLSGMEMRAKLLGGTLTITSNPETGTEVRIDVLLE